MASLAIMAHAGLRAALRRSGALWAPGLDALTARLAGVRYHGFRTAQRTDPERWAEALRDAVALARPDVVLTHSDCDLESDALRLAGTRRRRPFGSARDDDPLCEVGPLTAVAPVSETLVLVDATVRMHEGRLPVLAGMSGPGHVAASLADTLLGPSPGAGELAQLAARIGGLLAGVAEAYAACGVDGVIVREEAGELDEDALAAAHAPIREALAARDVPAVVAGPAPDTGLHDPDIGAPVVVAAATWTAPDAAFRSVWEAALREARDRRTLIVCERHLPAQTPTDRVLWAGERLAASRHERG